MKYLDEELIKTKIKKMKFKDAMDFFIDTLTYNALTKSNKNFFTSHCFLSYIKDNFEDFKKVVREDDRIRIGLANLFQQNTYIMDDNLISIIIDDTESNQIVDFLNKEIGFEDFYLNDNIMSVITPENKNIFEKLQGSKRKYLFALTNSITISEEEQQEIYNKTLLELPQKFINDLFLYSSIIRDNSPNEFERYIDINKAMFKFTEQSINNPTEFYNYIYNLNKVFGLDINQKNYFNAFLLSIKYPEIHNYMFKTKINNDDLYKKIRILTVLPVLKRINTIDDLNKIMISELYQQEIDNNDKLKIEPDSTNARGDYEFAIFNANREIIKIADDEIQSVELTDDDTSIVSTEYSHISGLRRLYPEYSDKEALGEIIIPANTEKHDILLITEGDSLNMWLPNASNLSQSQIELLKDKLNEVSDPQKIVVSVAMENDGNYLDIPFSTVDMLIEYLKNSKKVRK